MKQDSRTGALRVLEINPRFNLWHCLGAANGVNLPQVAYDYLVYGKRHAPARYRTKYRWHSLRNDLRACRELTGRKELGLLPYLASLAYRPKLYDVFSWTDPAPFLLELLERVKRMGKLPSRIWRRVFSVS